MENSENGAIGRAIESKSSEMVFYTPFATTSRLFQQREKT